MKVPTFVGAVRGFIELVLASLGGQPSELDFDRRLTYALASRRLLGRRSCPRR
ncbi:MAG: hypothetical protein AABZ38_03960 [candidate division NC10 bacterium]